MRIWPDHITGFRLQCRQVEQLIEYSCLCILVAFILGFACGYLIGGLW